MFTVVVPTYRSYTTLVESLNSCNHELIKEVIVVDDNFSNEREQIDKTTNFSNFKIFFNSRNMGVTYSRNKGYFNASQGFVIFLDSDDVLIKENLERAAKIISESKSDLYLFSTVTSGKLNSNSNDIIVGDIVKLFEMANSGERLLVIRKNKHKPFLGLLRGHELCGLFLWGLKSNAIFEWQPLPLREYSQGSVSSLSGQRLSKERATLISRGHEIIASRLYKIKKLKLSIKYLIKAKYYVFKSNCSR
ncbi:glycosyltransferase [Vibrio vulnificus]|nr:glycosyltransferase [Vibrio vulnificus]